MTIANLAVVAYVFAFTFACFFTISTVHAYFYSQDHKPGLVYIALSILACIACVYLGNT
jgi:hypothetical protein